MIIKFAKGNVDLVEQLSTVPGFDVNARDTLGHTALHLAALDESGACLDAVRYLLHRLKADPNVVDAVSDATHTHIHTHTHCRPPP